MTFHNFRVDIPYRDAQTIESEIERFIFENPAILLDGGRFIEPDTTIGLELHFCSIPENLQFDGSAGHAEAFGPSEEHMSVDFEFAVSSINLDSAGAQAKVALRITNVERLLFREPEIRKDILKFKAEGASRETVAAWAREFDHITTPPWGMCVGDAEDGLLICDLISAEGNTWREAFNYVVELCAQQERKNQ